MLVSSLHGFSCFHKRRDWHLRPDIAADPRPMQGRGEVVQSPPQVHIPLLAHQPVKAASASRSLEVRFLLTATGGPGLIRGHS